MAVVLLSWFLSAKVLQRVRPEEVAHGTKRWRLLEPVQLYAGQRVLYVRRRYTVHWTCIKDVFCVDRKA